MNLKDLQDVKELCDDLVSELADAHDRLDEELGPAEPGHSPEPDSPVADAGGESVGEGEAHADAGADPLVEALGAVERAFELVGDLLDITEPYRKRYEAQRDEAQRAAATARAATRGGSRRGRQHRESVAKGEEEVKNGESTRKARIAYRPVSR